MKNWIIKLYTYDMYKITRGYLALVRRLKYCYVEQKNGEYILTSYILILVKGHSITTTRGKDGLSGSLK